MAVKIFAMDLPEGEAATVVHHKLGTKDIVPALWQRGLTVTPSIQILDEDQVIVYNAYGGRLVLMGESKTRGTDGKGKSGTRSAASKSGEARRSSKSSS